MSSIVARATRLLSSPGTFGVGVALAGALCLIPPAAVQVPARVVHVPGLGWVSAADTPGVPATARDGERLRLVGEAAPAATVPPPASAPTAAAFGQPVRLNVASRAELESLPGVGPALAARIEAGRPYATVEELDRVKGIGPKLVARLRGRVQP